jgi:hypothetical protein
VPAGGGGGYPGGGACAYRSAAAPAFACVGEAADITADPSTTTAAQQETTCRPIELAIVVASSSPFLPKGGRDATLLARAPCALSRRACGPRRLIHRDGQYRQKKIRKSRYLPALNRADILGLFDRPRETTGAMSRRRSRAPPRKASGRIRCRRAVYVVGALCLLQSGPASAGEIDWWSRGYALEAFGGAVTTRRTTEILTGTVSFNRGGLIGVAGSKELAALGAGFARRGQLLATHRFAGLDYDELAVMFGLEYSAFPWSTRWPTSIEVSTGPSYATSVPTIEQQTSDSPSHWLNALAIELSIAPSAASPWSLLARYQHRSSAFGLYQGKQDESTALTAGIKYRF